MNDIVVAVIVGLSTGVPATIAALAALRKAALAEQHVRPNGQGPLPEMAERQLVMLGEIKGVVKDTQQRLEVHLDDDDRHNIRRYPRR